MLILGLILSVCGIGFLCWLLFTLSVYALPFFVGMTVGVTAAHHGFGFFVCCAAALLAGVATLVLGQLVFSLVRWTPLRGTIALIFALPGALAGYHATLGAAQFVGLDLGLAQITAAIGALLVGSTALSRMAFMTYRSGMDAADEVRPSMAAKT